MGGPSILVAGAGELTRSLHERTGASTTLGLDSSPAMLEKGASYAGEGLTFELGDIADWAPSEPVDLVFANAALHWVDDHAALFARLTSTLAPGGQLAVQVCGPTPTIPRTCGRSGLPPKSPSAPPSPATSVNHPC